MTYSRKVSCIEEENMSSKHYVKTEEALGRLTEQQRHVTQDEGTEPAYLDRSRVIGVSGG